MMFLRGFFFFNLNFLRNEGHTTMSCPHRVATEYGVTPASHRNAGNPVEYVFERQLRPNMPHVSVFLLFFLKLSLFCLLNLRMMLVCASGCCVSNYVPRSKVVDTGFLCVCANCL